MSWRDTLRAIWPAYLGAALCIAGIALLHCIAR